ncbi:MAG: phosphoesterase PA-phosphatase [Propionibacteriaceae bacterium]|nr:phosphoesterase PA-phosphatase [Propionibacteriaceae bacterium]
MITQDTDSTAATRQSELTHPRLARLVTEILAPAPTVAVLLLLVAWHSAPTTADAVRWGVLAALFASFVPFLYIVRGVRRGRLTDHHVRIREQRRLPLLVGIASVLVGLTLLALWGAPRELVALVASMVVGLASSLLVTLVWKISIHTAVVAGAATILVLVFGPPLLILSPLVALVCWARVAVRDHTPAQTITGVALGATVAAVVFSLLR